MQGIVDKCLRISKTLTGSRCSCPNARQEGEEE